jgi:hypothetical protein
MKTDNDSAPLDTGVHRLLPHAAALHQAGRLDEAARIYESILLEIPRHFDATHLLGVIALQQGRLQQRRKSARLDRSATDCFHRQCVCGEKYHSVELAIRRSFCMVMSPYSQANTRRKVREMAKSTGTRACSPKRGPDAKDSDFVSWITQRLASSNMMVFCGLQAATRRRCNFSHCDTDWREPRPAVPPRFAPSRSPVAQRLDVGVARVPETACASRFDVAWHNIQLKNIDWPRRRNLL